MIVDDGLLNDLPFGVYATDTGGRITFFNHAATVLWGQQPALETARWSGAFRLSWPDGRSLPNENCPLATAMRDGQATRGLELVAERPDGSRESFLAYPALMHDAAGKVSGCVNFMLDPGRRGTTVELERLAAIVASSDDAIVSKTLDGRITSWNRSAERIFGYTEAEMLGQSILRLIPPDRRHEEDDILARIRRGERVDHFDTVRLAKDGRRLDISVTISPLRDASGRIVGASKVARDITERKHSEALQSLLFKELDHRVRNTLAMIQAIARQSLHRSASPDDFVDSFNGRVQAFAGVHDLLVKGQMQGVDLADLVRVQFTLDPEAEARVQSTGPKVVLGPRLAVQMALVLHELAANARRHGALASADGRIAIGWTLQPGRPEKLVLDWKESGAAGLKPPGTHGFGMTIIRRSLEASRGVVSVDYGAQGLACRIELPLEDENGDGFQLMPT